MTAIAERAKKNIAARNQKEKSASQTRLYYIRTNAVHFLEETKHDIETEMLNNGACNTVKISDEIAEALGLASYVNPELFGCAADEWTAFVKWGESEGLRITNVRDHDGMGYESWTAIKVELI